MYSCANCELSPPAGKMVRRAPLGLQASAGGSGTHSHYLEERHASLRPTGSALGGPSVRVLMWPLAPSPPWEGESSHPEAS